MIALLKQDAQKVLSRIKESQRTTVTVVGAINWADLQVVGVRWWEDEYGECGYTVFVEEADRDCGLGHCMETELKDLGWKNVEVETEW